MNWFRRYWPYLLLALLVGCNVLVWLQRDRIADWWRLRGYEAPSSIAALASDTAMTDLAKHYFYINHPSLEEKDAFNEHCSDHSEETAVLGCYHGDRQGIYLYAVTDPRLDGVRQVTAAHEMLHQAYDRLSEGERERIGDLLQAYYDSTTNEDLKKKIDSYRKDKADLKNEMHSIFGTEVRELPAELETYYKQYFSDRQKVVSFAEAYQSEFTRREELSKQYDAQLDDLKQQFDANKAGLNSKSAFLKSKEKEIDRALASGDRAAYEAVVTDYNDMVSAYNRQLAEIRRIAAEYNRILALRKEVALQEHQLYEALDSSIGSEQQKQ